jgi:hypothetical protein
MMKEELNRVEIPADADDEARAASLREAKIRARDRFAAHMAAKLAQAEAERDAKAKAEEAERRALAMKGWTDWEKLDAERTAAFRTLEESLTAATLAASRAAQAYPADKSMLPKRYGTGPANIDGCAALAASQSDMLRRLRDKANEVAA